MKHITLLGWFLLFITSSYSQVNCTYKMLGIVRDSANKSAIAASIILENTTTQTTDEQGRFSLTGLCEGEHQLYVQSLGYRPKKIRVKIPCSLTEISLSSSVLNMHVFEFEEHKREEMEALNKTILGGKQLFIEQGNNLGETLKKLPGVSSLNTGNSISKPIIHGMHSNRVLILNNGIRHEGQNWGSEHAPEIDPTLAKNITLVKGANAVRYGSDAIAGVILVEANKLIDIDTFSCEVSSLVNSNGQGGNVSSILEYSHPKMSSLKARVQGTIRKLGDVTTPSYSMNNTGVKDYNYSAALGWVKEKKGFEVFYSSYSSSIGIFKGAHIGNLTDLDSAFIRSEPRSEFINDFSYSIQRPKQVVKHQLAKLRGYTEFSNVGKFNIVYAFQNNVRDEFDAHRQRGSILNASKPELTFTLSTQTFDVIWEHRVTKGFSGSAGFSNLIQSNAYQGRNLIPNFNTFSSGLFFIEHYKKKQIEIEFGMRYDYRETHVVKRNKNNALYQPSYYFRIPSGTLGIIYSHQKIVLKGYIGTAFRAPAINELFIQGVHHGNGTYEIGNEHLVSEQAYNASINLLYTGKIISIQTEIYSNYIKNYIYLQASKPAVLTVLGAFPTFTYEQSNAHLSGNDLQVNFHMNKYVRVELKSSQLYAWNLSKEKWIEFMPANRYELNTILNYKKYNVDFSATYIGKQTRVTPGIDYAPPPNAYTLFSVQLNREYQFRKSKVLIALGVNNLFNKTYRDYLNSYRYYSNDLGRNINLKIKINL